MFCNFLVHILAILSAHFNVYFNVFKCITIRSLIITNDLPRLLNTILTVNHLYLTNDTEERRPTEFWTKASQASKQVNLQ
jgi:hypothetical protein